MDKHPLLTWRAVYRALSDEIRSIKGAIRGRNPWGHNGIWGRPTLQQYLFLLKRKAREMMEARPAAQQAAHEIWMRKHNQRGGT